MYLQELVLRLALFVYLLQSKVPGLCNIVLIIIVICEVDSEDLKEIVLTDEREI